MAVNLYNDSRKTMYEECYEKISSELGSDKIRIHKPSSGSRGLNPLLLAEEPLKLDVRIKTIPSYHSSFPETSLPEVIDMYCSTNNVSLDIKDFDLTLQRLKQELNKKNNWKIKK